MGDEDDQASGYLDSCVGTTIRAVHEDDDSYWLHLSDGTSLQFYVDADGLNVEVHKEVTH